MIISDEVFNKIVGGRTRSLEYDYNYTKEINPNIITIIDVAQESLQSNIIPDIDPEGCIALIDNILIKKKCSDYEKDLLYIREHLSTIRDTDFVVDYTQASNVVRDAILTLNVLFDAQEHANKS